jgi:hypothetical protein
MSVRAECWAFGAEVSSSLQRVVLMGLATFADEHDEVVVSASVLTRIAVAGRRELWSTLAELESAGLLEVVRTADVALASDEVPARRRLSGLGVRVGTVRSPVTLRLISRRAHPRPRRRSRRLRRCLHAVKPLVVPVRTWVSTRLPSS